MGQHPSPALSAPVETLAGVGPKISERLSHLGIKQIQDLLFHLPCRYIDRTRLLPIGSLVAGSSALCQGAIEQVQVLFGKRRSLLCRISDGSGSVTLRFFHFSKAQQATFKRGLTLRCWGQIREGSRGVEMIHPEYMLIGGDENVAVEETLTPVYPATQGISQRKLRNLTSQALSALTNEETPLKELLSEELLNELAFLDLINAIEYVHRPPKDADMDALMEGRHPAQQRLAFEELLAHHLSLRLVRKQLHKHESFKITEKNAADVQAFLHKLPFKLTGAQQKVLGEIKQDLSKQQPMLRLIQGDVGSGKTVVAAIAAMHIIQSGYQVALMAPTELLADQHYFNIKQWLSPFDVPVFLLTGKQPRPDREESLACLHSSQPLLVVGTHALFQEQVAFGHVGLIIIDEQHRFGVDQRLALLEKGTEKSRQPHQLIMTATPIPRTLAMTLFADLDISIIDELPPGREPVKTTVISNEKRAAVIKRIHEVCRQGRQVYWVCTLIEGSASLQLEAAEDIQKHLAEALTHITVGLIHGKMKSADKESVMADFKCGRISVLVATTVIEVGVDVPNASLMVIENAERLGLSQLHQLRGRVGRGSQMSDCVLLYQTPLSDNAQARLNKMRRTNDGFDIAKSDLALRGPGELLGRRQTGMPEFRVANLVRDTTLIAQVRQAADIILTDYPERVHPLIARWLKTNIHFGKV